MAETQPNQAGEQQYFVVFYEAPQSGIVVALELLPAKGDFEALEAFQAIDDYEETNPDVTMGFDRLWL